MTPIPIVDIFAGPGGLGEGFSGFSNARGCRAFRVGLSIEMDEHAHRTLLLRSFFRQFDPGEAPSAYYEYLRGEGRWHQATCEDLFSIFPIQAEQARSEAWKEELRPAVSEEVDRRVSLALGPRRSRPPWVLIGGPPCQAYSLIGRARMLGVRGDEFYADKRHSLYREYLRLLEVHRPAVFVMENVKGLLSATSRSGTPMFQRILSDLQSPGGGGFRYRLFSLSPADPRASAGSVEEEDDDVRRFVVRCERHGIPQSRHRLIILGVSESDYGHQVRLPKFLEFAPRPISCGIAMKGLPRLRSGLSRECDSPEAWVAAIASARSSAWLRELGRGEYADVAAEVRSVASQIAVPRAARGARFIRGGLASPMNPGWLHDPRLGGACNHDARAHRADDLHRYLFVSCFGRVRGLSPSLREFPPSLLPAHRNIGRALGRGVFNDRFRVQLARFPATTITSHIAKDGHYFIHGDPSQCRSLTVREAARVQTFPDNYFFEGPRTEQYQQVGNAVPPLLAREIAGIVYEGMLREWK